MNNYPSSVSAETVNFTNTSKQVRGVVVSLVGEFVGKTLAEADGVSRRFLVDKYCIAGGCADEVVTLYVKPPHIEAVKAIPSRVTVELSNVYVVNKGTHSYASTNRNFTTDYEPAKPKQKSQKKTRRTPSSKAGLTVRTPKAKPVRGKYK